MINKAQSDFHIVSQWGIGRSGRGAKLFDNFAKGKIRHYLVTSSIIF
jgi:hypothetical protein